jgi:DNA recombination protein RmuC
MEYLNLVLVFVVGLITGVLAIWFQSKGKQVELIILKERETALNNELNKVGVEMDSIQRENESLQLKCIESQKEAAGLAASLIGLQQQNQILTQEREQDVLQLTSELKQLKADIDALQALNQKQSNEVAQLVTSLEAEKKQAEEKIALIQNAEKQLTEHFKNIASDILEDKSRRFTEQNQTNLDQLLAPLKDKLTEFKTKVEEVYVQEGKERSALGEQVKQLMELNHRLSDDAHNLTRALKGQAKAQGNWGEMILERVLTSSGLRKGHEYDVQENHVREDQSRAQPDVVIHLPEDRHLIVDAKVSIVAYDDYANADTDAERESALKRHKESVRNHVKGLSEKNYQKLYGLKSLDFVLMFVPIEPAFMLAISNDSELWDDAWKKNVLLVSPSTLLFVVRTVAHLWRQEQQNKNAQDIAERGALLYDKLVGFVDDLDRIGQRIDQAKVTYDQAYGKFKSGAGNVIRQAEMLKSLGIKPTKSLDSSLILIASEDE